MKVIAKISIDIDPDKYRAEYGEWTTTNNEIRDDIKQRVLDSAIAGLHFYGPSPLFTFVNSIKIEDAR